jgi:hypothetical protein
VSRRFGYVLLGALLVACALGFARAEQLKLSRATVGSPTLPAHWSPDCDAGRACTEQAEIRFVLRRPARVAARVVDEDGAPVRTLLAPERRPRGRVELRWDGRREDGLPAPEGPYRLEIELVDEDRTMRAPSRLNLDRTPPSITISGIRRADGRVVVRYATSEPALVFLNVTRILRGGRLEPVPGALTRGRRGSAVWRADGAPPGRYAVQLVGRDRAGIPADEPATARLALP